MMSIAPAMLESFNLSAGSDMSLPRDKTYDNEQIQVSIITVCAFPRRFKIWSRQASKQSAAFSTTTVSKAG